jgi:hypothetical protein
MSSLEMVEFINSQRGEGEVELLHKNFLAKVPQVLGEYGAAKFSATYIHPQNKQSYPCYRFPKREACLMAMSYSYELQAKVFDRMTELEQGKPITPAIPQSLPEALRLAADLAEQNGEQALLIEQQKPAVEFVKQYVEAKASKCLSDVAKLIGWKPRAFTKQQKPASSLSSTPDPHAFPCGNFGGPFAAIPYTWESARQCTGSSGCLRLRYRPSG